MCGWGEGSFANTSKSGEIFLTAIKVSGLVDQLVLISDATFATVATSSCDQFSTMFSM